MTLRGRARIGTQAWRLQNPCSPRLASQGDQAVQGALSPAADLPDPLSGRREFQ